MARRQYYLYKDTFLSGWGSAPKGSFVIATKPIVREEFKLKGVAETLQDIHFRSTKGKHFVLWEEPRSEMGRPKRSYRLYKIGGKWRKRVH